MKVRINQKIIMYIILLSIVIEPKIFTQYPITTVIYSVLNILMFLFFLLKSKKIKLDIPIVLWIVVRLYLLVIMIINFNFSDIEQWGYLSLMVMNIYFIIKNSIIKNEADEMISAGSLLSILFLCINAYTLIKYPHGIIASRNIYSNGDGDFYFLGIKVAYTTYVLAALSFGLLDYKINNKKITSYLVFILSIFNILYANVSTGIVCLLMISILILLSKKAMRVLSLKLEIFFSLAMNILVVLFGIQKIFASFIVNVLHKSLTLTGRTAIWDSAINVLKNNGLIRLLVGNGVINNSAFVPLGNGYWQAHNVWLQYLYEAGLIGTLIFVYMLFACDKNNKNKTKERYYLLTICFAILFSTITTFNFGYAHIFIPFFLLYFIDSISKKKVIKNEN